MIDEYRKECVKLINGLLRSVLVAFFQMKEVEMSSRKLMHSQSLLTPSFLLPYLSTLYKYGSSRRE